MKAKSFTSLLISIGLNILTRISIADAMLIVDRTNDENEK